MSDKYEVRATELSREAAGDETGVNIAFVRVSRDGEITVNWLPELFSRPMDPETKMAIVEKLRFHADKLESGEMEKTMQRFAGINLNPNRSTREQ